MVIATAQFTISVVNDGVGIQSSIIEYCASASGTTPPGSPMTDGSGNIITSNTGDPLTDGAWSTTLPTVPAGYYLWTRTRLIRTDSTFDMIYSVSYYAEDGATGATGKSISSVVPEYRLSDSSTSLTGSGTGYSWSTTMPQVDAGQFVWQRMRNTFSDGSVLYSDATCDITISGLVFDVDRNSNSITSKVWQSDVSAAISSYDSTTSASLRDRVTQTETDISGINTTISDIQSAVSTKADGSTVTTLTQRVQTVEDTASSHTRQITAINDTVEDLQTGTRNLVLSSNTVKTSANSIATYDLSDYGKTVIPGSQIVISAELKSTVADSDIDVYLRTQDGQVINPDATIEALNTDYGRYSVKLTIPSGTHPYTLAFAGQNSSATYTIKNVQVETGNILSDWHRAPEDVDAEVSSVTTVATQTADKFTWLVDSGTTASNFTITDRLASLTSDWINLNGTVTMSAFDSNMQQKILALGTELITGTQASSTSAWTGKSVLLAELAAGTKISYKLPYASTNTAVTLNLTLNDNTTTTGAKNVYYVGTTQLTTQYPQNSIIDLIYDGTAWRVVNPYTDIDTYDTTKYNATIKATSSGITAGNIIVGYQGTYHHLKTGTVFNVTMPILYANGSLSANGTGSNNYIEIPFAVATTQNITLTPYLPVYIKGTLVGTSFTPVSTTPLTQTIPTSNDTYKYMYLGTAYSATSIYLEKTHPIYQWFRDGFKTTDEIAADGGAAAYSAYNWVTNTGENAATIISNWATDATHTTTTIKGGLIQTNTITSAQLATDAIMSSNYIAGGSGSPYSSYGTFLDLSTGNIYMPNFGVDAQTGAAYFNGEITAVSGTIGDDTTNNWTIGTITDYNGNDSAALIGNGTSYIQSGNWQISNNRINTQWYNNLRQITYPNNDGYYYDFGMKVPSLTSTYEYDKNFLYIRKHQSTIPSLESDWAYIFRVDRDGNLYANNITLTGSNPNFLPSTGGTISGNLTVTGTLTATVSSATALATGRSIQTDLSSTSGATFNGTADITPGVTGTLGVGNGGTGKSQWTAYGIVYASTASVLSQLSAGTSGQVLVSGGSSAAPAWANASTLTAGSVGENLIIKLNGGSTEGTNKFTYNGSAEKTINITKSSVGLGNVDNTADANKTVSHASTAGTATSAGKWTSGVTLTVGGTGKSVDGSGNVSWSKSDISGLAQPASGETTVTSNAGWMSGQDKYKLDSITVTSGGGIGINNITVERGLSNTSQEEGVYQIGHSNSITAGTASGTATSTIGNGGTFNIPTITYDAYGHITNKGTTTITVSISSVTSATKATQDGDGATISSTYAKLAGAAFTGAVTGTSFGVTGYLAANTGNSSTTGGLALYGTSPTTYGIAMRGTGNGGKHGYVQGDWAIYSYMTGTAASATSSMRGWILRNGTSTTNVASVSANGDAAFSGKLCIGANTAGTSGCVMQYNSTTKSLSFSFLS